MSDTAADFTCCRYGAADERPHDMAGAENYNESVYFNFYDPRLKVGGIVRVGNRPSLGYREFSVNLKLPGGIVALRAGREISSGNVDFSCRGLSLEMVEATRRWRLRFEGSVALIAQPERLASEPRGMVKSSPSADVSIDLEWNATTPVFVLNADGSGKLTPGTSPMGTDHYEQFGTVTGSLRVGDSGWQLSGTPSMRDHTWGPRIWGTFNGEWMCAFLPDGTSMTLYSELLSTGLRAFNGVVMFEGQPRFVERFDVATAYDGAELREDRHRSVVKAQGLPPIPLDGVISHFAPLTMATGPHRSRLSSMVVEFVGGAGGVAFAEYLRPLAAASETQ